MNLRPSRSKVEYVAPMPSWTEFRTIDLCSKDEISAIGIPLGELALDRCHLLGGLLPNIYILHPTRRLQDRQPILPHPFEMEFNRLADFDFHLLQSVADRHAAGQIGTICRIIPLAFLDHDGVTHWSILEARLPQDALQRAQVQMGIE